MNFETVSLLLNWLQMGALLAILFRLASTHELIATLPPDLKIRGPVSESLRQSEGSAALRQPIVPELLVRRARRLRSEKNLETT
jgi:hypothetical protein